MNSSIKAGLSQKPPPFRMLVDEQGRQLAFSSYPAPGSTLHLLISHGFGEHRGWYHHVACAFQDAGVSAYTFDHFHHGRSDGQPGDLENYGELPAGLVMALEQGVMPEIGPDARIALLGHSNGGLALLRALPNLPALPRQQVTTVVLSNPLLGLPGKMAFWGGLAMGLLSLINPAMSVPRGIAPEYLTADETLWEGYRQDPLRFKSATPRIFREMAQTARQTSRSVSCLDFPLLVLCGGKDRVVDSQATRRWFDRLEAPAKQWMAYPGLRHELFNESSWRDVVGDTLGWLQSRNPEVS